MSMKRGPEKLWYVTTFEVESHYGGPEEGGWSFDVGRPVEVETAFTEAFADFRARTIDNAAYEERQKLPKFGYWLTLPRTQVRVTYGKPADAFPDRRPHYE